MNGPHTGLMGGPHELGTRAWEPGPGDLEPGTRALGKITESENESMMSCFFALDHVTYNVIM